MAINICITPGVTHESLRHILYDCCRFNYQHKVHESAESSLEALRTKNMVYCAILLEEFLKELAAISQEHAVAYQK